MQCKGEPEKVAANVLMNTGDNAPRGMLGHFKEPEVSKIKLLKYIFFLFLGGRRFKLKIKEGWGVHCMFVYYVWSN